MNIRIGTAGWGIPTALGSEFPGEGTHLERYSCVFNAVEINSSFYRPHRRTTYERWADSAPETFRFAVKVPKAITHEHRLRAVGDLLDQFLSEVGGLGSKLGPLLVQLPPSLAFDAATASAFFDHLQGHSGARIACEPRHQSWFDADAERLLEEREIARVAADPVKTEGADWPGGWRGLVYYRLHGSPVPYRSGYEPERLAAYAECIRSDRAAGRDAWSIFDNTASSAATGNALTLLNLLGKPQE